MIEKISKTLMKVESAPYLAYGGGSAYKRAKKPKEPDKNLQEILEEIDESALSNRKNNKTNPFEADFAASFSKKPDNKIQQYFEGRYGEIYAFIKDASLKLSKGGEIRTKIDDALLEADAVCAKYQTFATLPQSEEKTCRIVGQSGNNIQIAVLNRFGEIYLRIFLENSAISKIESIEEGFLQTLYFKKQSAFSRLLNPDKNPLQRYEKRNSKGRLTETVEFSGKNLPQKYTYLEEDGNSKQIVFDCSDYANLFASKAEKIIPLEYSKYCGEDKLESLFYLYSKPVKYEQYSAATGKTVKAFNLRGLSPAVYKYAFFNGLTGQMLASGSL